LLWVPSQNGLVDDRVHLQSLKVPGVLEGGGTKALPSSSTSSTSPWTKMGPCCLMVILGLSDMAGL